MSNILILDIGKTNIKVHLLNEKLESLFETAKRNAVVDAEPYPYFDTESIWEWFCAAVAEIGKHHAIAAISVTTHGATAACIDRTQPQNGGLVLPVLDYEYGGPDETNAEYRKVRSDFSETRSPELPGGLNLGRQLYWLAQRFPQDFARTTDILLYPQYWVWRMTGQLCAEKTSLGCHTDLWHPEADDYSSLVDRMHWRSRFPQIQPANHFAGRITPEFSARTGLADTCQVAVGIHDSNASYLRYVQENQGEPFSVISTGTWAITMTNGAQNVALDESRDMLMNVDFRGDPVPCARFMAGREYEEVCHRMGSVPESPFSAEDITALIDEQVYALPAFCETSGPFSGTIGTIVGDSSRANGAALASLYCALMLDLELDLLNARGKVFIEGAFLKNPLLCQILAALRKHHPIYLSNDSTGTVQGAAALALTHVKHYGQKTLCQPLPLENLVKYREKWRSLCPSAPSSKQPTGASQ